MTRFAHLSVRSTFSLREGACRPEEIAARAAALGMDAVAITDTNALAGAVRFTKACKAAGIKPVYGARLTVGPDPAPPDGAPPTQTPGAPPKKLTHK